MCVNVIYLIHGRSRSLVSPYPLVCPPCRLLPNSLVYLMSPPLLLTTESLTVRVSFHDLFSLVIYFHDGWEIADNTWCMWRDCRNLYGVNYKHCSNTRYKGWKVSIEFFRYFKQVLVSHVFIVVRYFTPNRFRFRIWVVCMWTVRSFRKFWCNKISYVDIL